MHIIPLVIHRPWIFQTSVSMDDLKQLSMRNFKTATSQNSSEQHTLWINSYHFANWFLSKWAYSPFLSPRPLFFRCWEPPSNLLNDLHTSYGFLIFNSAKRFHMLDRQHRILVYLCIFKVFCIFVMGIFFKQYEIIYKNTGKLPVRYDSNYAVLKNMRESEIFMKLSKMVAYYIVSMWPDTFGYWVITRGEK